MSRLWWNQTLKDGYPLSKEVFAAVTEKTEINHGQAILDISKTLTYEFRLNISSISIEKRSGYAIWTQIVLYMR